MRITTDHERRRVPPRRYAGSVQGPSRHKAIALRKYAYDVHLLDVSPEQAFVELTGYLRDRRSMLITTPTVERLYGGSMRVGRSPDESDLVLPCSECSKNMAIAEDLCRHAADHAFGRNDALISVGGGVCSDIVTMSASIIRRGVRHVRVPTTLIGQVDAGVGYKGAVNMAGKKSFVGCFHPPARVFIVPDFLQSLPERHLRAGLSEMVKIALVADAELLDAIEQHGVQLLQSGFQRPRDIRTMVIWRSIVAMVEQLDQNPFEDKTYRRLVDFGHTFSPLIESATGFRMSHGDAVAVDMALTLSLGAELGLTTRALRDRTIALLKRLHLPVYHDALTLELCEESITGAMLHRGGDVNLVVPIAVGQSVFLSSPESLTDAAIHSALRHLARARNGVL